MMQRSRKMRVLGWGYSQMGFSYPIFPQPQIQITDCFTNIRGL